ncbi:MAG: ComEC/Rec2 family competence protein [Polymorphobacter sp.]|uniref:ComEC/Rec2 family competence protein n=1 Tax=Polymorphobacter sp. TaxID=1909290 RepID=UPI003A8926AA
MTSRTLGAVQTAWQGWPEAAIAARLAALGDTEREALPLWLPVALGAGIAAWFALPWSGQRLALALACVGLGAALLLLGRRWPGALMLMVVVGLGATEFRVWQVAHEVLPARRLARFEAVVQTVEPRVASGQLRLGLSVGSGEAGLPDRVRVNVRGAAATRAEAMVEPGARVAVRAMLLPPPSPAVPGGFDSARALYFDGVGATGAVLGDVTLLAAAPEGRGWRAWLAGTRREISARIRAAVPGAAGAVAAVFVTGDRSAVPQETSDAVRDAGLAHLLSISGLHMAVVVGGVILIARRLLTLWPWLALRLPVRGVALALGALAGLGYTLLAGGAVPTIRSLLATLIVLAGLMAGREAISLRLLATAAFLILLVRPEYLLGPSFQMSFAAVAAIVALYETPIGRRWLGPREREGRARQLGRGGIALLMTGLVAELVLTPIGLYHFQQSGVYGVVSNLLAIPLASFGIIPALLLGLAADALGVGAAAYAPAGWFVARLLDIADATAAMPGAVARLPTLPDLAFGLIIMGGLWLLLWRSVLRLVGLPVILAGAVFALAAAPADLLVSRDGRHVALRTDGGDIALSRARMGGFLRDVWGSAMAASGGFRRFDELPEMRCTRDSCLGLVRGRTLFVTRSPDGLARGTMEPACLAADLVISDRRLPDWCRARWMTIDAAMVANRGALALWLESGRMVGSLDGLGDHPWYGQSRPFG